MKKITSILTVIIMLCCFNSTVFADNVPDLTIRGSIQITMRSGGTYVPGGNLTLYKVGDIYENDGNYSFVLTDSFAESQESLDDIQSSQLADNLARYAERHSIAGIKKEIDQNANIAFTDLDLGLYLLVQEQAAEGYNKVSPFLVSVPMQENGAYIYDVDASPKVELDKLIEPDTPDTPPNPPGTPTNPGHKLPQTGQLNWPIPVLVVSGIAIFIIGWWIKFGRKKGQYEK